MQLPTHETIFWLAIGIQCMGIISVLAARMSEHSRSCGFYQTTMIGSLLAVGLVTIMALSQGNSNWHSCAMTLGMMCIGATIDSRSMRRTASS
jgi:hypothetical protein